jgi:hypothetical protein
MKVTKAKGLNTDLTGSSGYNPRATVVQLMRTRWQRMHRIRESPRVEPNQPSSWFVAMAASQIVLAPLLWLLSFDARVVDVD